MDARKKSRHALWIVSMAFCLTLGGIIGATTINATISSTPTAIVSPYSCEKGADMIISVDNAATPVYYAVAGAGTTTVPCGTLIYGGPNNSGGITGTSASAVINAAGLALAGTGGTLYFECGLYTTTALISVYEGVNYVGCGQGWTATNNGALIRSTGNYPVFNVTRSPASATHSIFTTITELAIQGTNNIADTANNGIYQANSLTFDLYIDHVSVSLCYNGVYISSGSKTRMAAVTIEGNLNYGIDAVQNYLISVTEASYIRSNTAYGFFGYAQNLELTDSYYILNVGGGIEISNFGANVQNTEVVTGNIFDSNGGAAGTSNLRLDGTAVNATVVGNTFSALDTTKANHDIFLSNGANGVITSNVIMAASSSSTNVISTNTGEVDTFIRSNLGYNPIGKIASNFLVGGRSAVTYHTIGPFGGNSTTEVASVTYEVSYTDCFINSADSANSNNAILIKDLAGNTMLGPVHTLTAQFIPAAFTITWGAFTGVAGTVTIFCN